MNQILMNTINWYFYTF